MEFLWRQVATFRARRGHLDRRVPRSELLSAVSDIGGLHAQVMSSAELSVWARVEDVEPDAVPTALWEDRTLVKLWAMRGTLHLLPAGEYRLWQAALSRYDHYRAAVWRRGFGITAEELDALLDAVPRALDGPPLTRRQLADKVASITGSAALGDKVGESWGALLKPASFRGDLCFAPSAGQNVRFTRPDRWLPLGPPVDPDDAATELTRRYLATYGPATRTDYSHWWGGLSPARAGKLIAGLGDEVVPVDLEGGGRGEQAWLLASDLDELGFVSGEEAGSVRLLPAFDPYVIEASTRPERFLAGPHRNLVYRPQGWLTPVLLVDGQMHGVWRHKKTARKVSVEVEPFRPLPRPARNSLDQEAERVARFLGGALDLTVKQPLEKG